MKTTNDFLDAVRAKHGLTSDYQLSKFLRCQPSAIYNYRSGRSRLDESMTIKVADALGLDHVHVLASIAAERTKDATVKRAWQKAAAATAAILAAVVVAALPDQADQLAAFMVAAVAEGPLVIMSNTRMFSKDSHPKASTGGASFPRQELHK